MQGALLTCALLLAFASAAHVLQSCRADSSSSAARRLLAEMQEQMRRGEGAITFPVYHRSIKDGEFKKGPIRQRRSTLDISNLTPPGTNTSSPSQVNDLKSTLVTLNEPFGQYFAVFDIGTPPIEIAVIIDTGSQILWINCLPCIECGVQAKGYEYFNPNQSTSFGYLSCTDMGCPGDNSVATSCDGGRCFYHVTYGDKSNSSGYLSTDTLSVGTATKGASPYTYKDFVFGCGHINNGIESQLNASGLMGLDRGQFSIISQLNVSIFAHCLPNRIRTTDVTGYLTLGNSSLTSNIALAYTPMIQNTASDFLSQFYYMNMTGISINGKLLDIPSFAFEITTNAEAGGTIIDSGTTLTSFVEEAYTIFADAFASALDPSLVKADSGSSNLLCYQVPVYQNAPQAPNVTLHFANNVNLDLDTDHSFRLHSSDLTYSYYCMAFNNAGSIDTGGRNFIGNYQQQDFLVEYDIGNSRIGFAPHVCNQGRSSTSDSTSIYSIKWLSSGHLLWVASTLMMLMI